MSQTKETRQGGESPTWVVVDETDRAFGWYGDTVTELSYEDHWGRDIRLAVSNRTRRVIRWGVADSDVAVNLAQIPGLIRRFYGADCYGHTEWFVAVD
jgi:hypothetical protein